MTNNTSSGISLLLIVAILAWFTYGTLSGVLGIVLLYIVMGFVALLSLIPIVGIFVMWFVSETWVIPSVLSFTQLSSTWLTSAIIIGMYAIGVFCTTLTSLAVLSRRSFR